MLKKFVSSVLAVLLLAGCAGGKKADADAETNASAAADIAAEIVNELNMSDSLSAMKDRAVYGAFLGMVYDNEDDLAVVPDCAAYRGSDNSSDTVAVFRTTDAGAVKDKITSYLADQKANSSMYNPDELFKISNAVVETSAAGDLVILVICEEIEPARAAVNKALGK